VPLQRLGTVGGDALRVSGDFGVFDVPVDELRAASAAPFRSTFG
jgi:hypothetical protein